MSKKPSRNLQLEREVLVRRSMLLREQIAHDVGRLQPKLRVADSAFDAIDWVKANPGIVVAVVGTLFVLRPKRMIGLGVRAWGLWRLGSRAMPMVRMVQSMRR